MRRDDGDGHLAYMFKDLLDLIQSSDPLTYRVFQIMSITRYPLCESDLQTILQIGPMDDSDLHTSLEKLVEYSLCTSQEDRYSVRSLAREYGRNTLSTEPMLESTLRESWINFFLELADQNGGDDWSSYRDKFNRLDSYWDNLKEVFRFLQVSWKRDSSKSYGDAKKLWKALQRFTYLYGYWSEREEWTNALIQEADAQTDNLFHAQLLAANGWIMLMREGMVDCDNACDQFERALAILGNPFSLPEANSSVNDVSLTIYLNLAAARVRKLEFSRANDIFKEFLLLWRKMTTYETRKIGKQNRHINRFYIRYLLYRGEYFYRRDMPFRAERYYRKVDLLCEKIEWIRFRAKANERIAYLKIRTEERSELQEAQKIIKEWLRVSQLDCDKRRVAFFQKDYALLWNIYGYHKAARSSAESALKVFEELNMSKRIIEMKEFINQLPAERTQFNTASTPSP